MLRKSTALTKDAPPGNYADNIPHYKSSAPHYTEATKPLSLLHNIKNPRVEGVRLRHCLGHNSSPLPFVPVF